MQTGVSDEEILEQVENLKKEEQKENYDEKYQLFQDILNRDREGERGQTLAKAITQGSLALMEGQGAESVQEALKAFAGEIEKGDARTRDLQDKAKVLAIQEIQKDPERKLAKEDLALRRDIAEQDIDLRKDALDVQKFSAETTRAYNEGRLALDSYIN